MEQILKKIEPLFLEYEEDFNGFINPMQALEIIEYMDEDTERSYREVFKSNLLKKQIFAKDIAQWIFTKEQVNGGGILALFQITVPRYINQAQQLFESLQIKLENQGKEKEASILFAIGEIQNQESKLELQFALGGKQNPTVSAFPELIKGCPAIIFSIGCDNPEETEQEFQQLIDQTKDFLIDTAPTEVAQIIEIIEIQIRIVGNKKVAIALSFPLVLMEEITNTINKFIGQFIGDGTNELLIDLEFSSSLSFKKFTVDREKQMCDVLFDDEQSLQLLLKLLIPGPLSGNVQKIASILVAQIFGENEEQFSKYSSMIAPLFLLQQFALAFKFKSLEEFIERGEDVEIVEDFIESGIKNTPQEFKERLNNKYQFKEIIERIFYELPIANDFHNFLGKYAFLDFELILQISELRMQLMGKSDGCKEAFEFIMEEIE